MSEKEAVKLPFVHCAELILEPGADHRAPGGAVTVALCGSWDHEGACRWPHHSDVESHGGTTLVRVVFIADAHEESVVRTSIHDAFAGGRCTGPDGNISRWSMIASDAGVLTLEERGWAVKMEQPREANR